jgi:hypothetical protein
MELDCFNAKIEMKMMQKNLVCLKMVHTSPKIRFWDFGGG